MNWNFQTWNIRDDDSPVHACKPIIQNTTSQNETYSQTFSVSEAERLNLVSRNEYGSHSAHCPFLVTFLGALPELRKAIISFVMSVRQPFRLHRTRLSLDWFWWNLIFEFFQKTCRRNSAFRYNPSRITCTFMKTFLHLRQHLAAFFLEWEMYQVKVLDKLKTHILCSTTFLRKSCRLWDNVEKCGATREEADGNVAARCILDN
jgi:hypothetical protein